MQYCPSCEAELADHAVFCSRCGGLLSATVAVDEARDKRRSLVAADDIEQQDTLVVRSLVAANDIEQQDTLVVHSLVAAGDKRHSPSSVDVQPLAVSINNSLLSTLYHKVLGNLPTLMQHVFAAVLTRAQDPKAEELPTSRTSHQQMVQFRASVWGWLPMLTLTSAWGILSVVYAFTTLRYFTIDVTIFFWLGLLLIFVPPMVRLISPAASRFERIGLLCVVGICFYLVNVLDTPFAFIGHDPLLHTRTADDITSSGHLFTENPLLPASPFYPGLEIVTNALSTLSGLSTHDAGIIVLGMGRLVIILSLFLFYELVTKSPRIAGIATMIYMTNPHFLFFDAQFSYESLALPLATLVLFAMARHATVKNGSRWMMLVAWIILGAVVVTPHMTDYVLDGFFILWTLMSIVQHPARLLQSDLAKTALFGIIISVAWVNLPGNPVVSYLSSYFASAFDNLKQVLNGASSARPLFANYAGQPTPLWERIMAASSVVIITLCLPFGLLCLWRRYRYHALAGALGIASLFYPISHAFRLTTFGSEISDRAAAFLFIPLGCVLAIFITQFWPTRRLDRKRTSFIVSALSVMLLGGVVLGEGQPWQIFPGPYLVAADSRSIEPEGINAAIWAPSYLGPNNRIATDRVNGLLMSAYGYQRIVTALADNVDESPVFFSSTLGPHELSIQQDGKIRYLVVDQRLSTGLPYLGFYFEPGEPGAFEHTVPIPLEALTKFNTRPQINRVFDSGDIIIYDVGGLINAPEKP